MREALAALDLVVVIDVAMTETARLAHYVLPASTQYEKWEATFFNFEFPRNVFHLRAPLLDAARRAAARAGDPRPAGGGARRRDGRRPGPAAGGGRNRGGQRVGGTPGTPAEGPPSPRRSSPPPPPSPRLGAVAPVVLYRTLGPTLPDGAAAAALLWAAAHKCAQANPEGVRRAGFTGEGVHGRRAAVRSHPVQPVGRRDHRRRVRRLLAADPHAGRAGCTSRSPSCSTS